MISRRSPSKSLAQSYFYFPFSPTHVSLVAYQRTIASHLHSHPHDRLHLVMPPPPLNLTRLNPTTITVPTGTPNGKILKVAISPHLLIQSPILESPPVKARKDADALFEVIVPVGGRVEVDLGVEGVEDLENTTGRTWYEYEVEDAVRRLVKRLIELVSLRVPCPQKS